MDQLIKETQTSASMTVFHNYANYNAEQVPSLWLPWNTSVYGGSNDLHNATSNPQYWTCGNATCRAK